MKDILKKTILFGLGLGAITRDKAEGLVKDLRKKGYFDEKEGKKLVNEIIAESLRTQNKINAYVRTHVKEAMDSAPFATKQDLKNLEKRLSKKKKR